MNPTDDVVDRSGCAAIRHGTETAYSKDGCRCPDAREDSRIRAKRRKHGTYQYLYIDPTGTRRRLQALMALGHNANTISSVEPALSVHMVRYLRSGKPGTPSRRVHRRLAATVARVYAVLSMVPGIDNRSARQAETMGYRPPLAWDDESIDDPHAQPTATTPGRVDRRAEVAWLVEGGESLERAVRRVGMTVSGWERARYRRAS